jgi:hypothetical protein
MFGKTFSSAIFSVHEETKSVETSSSSSSSSQPKKSNFLSGVSGSLAGISTELIFYGLDSYKVSRQAGKSVKFNRLFSGAVPIALSGSGPAFAVFFSCYHTVRDLTQSSQYASMSVLLASGLSAIPYSFVSVPADVCKKRLIIESATNPTITLAEVVKHIHQQHGWRGYFLGWKANMTKDVPFAGIKMSLYEACAYLYLKATRPAAFFTQHENFDSKLLLRYESAIVGFLSGAMTAILTTPLDCVNTRIKSGEIQNMGLVDAHMYILKKDGFQALFRGLLPRITVIGFGSTVFWYNYAIIDNFINQEK